MAEDRAGRYNYFPTPKYPPPPRPHPPAPASPTVVMHMGGKATVWGAQGVKRKDSVIVEVPDAGARVCTVI